MALTFSLYVPVPESDSQKNLGDRAGEPHLPEPLPDQGQEKVQDFPRITLELRIEQGLELWDPASAQSCSSYTSKGPTITKHAPIQFKKLRARGFGPLQATSQE